MSVEQIAHVDLEASLSIFRLASVSTMEYSMGQREITTGSNL